MPALTDLNNLLLSSDGIWRTSDATGEFGYSDGSEVETYLKKCFRECADLSSTSTELEQRIIDWPSEYHLSPMRVNLLRPFDLKQLNRVLELGAGCGTITRYLGEADLSVDAIEGSATRASLARQRCRGLENVSVINTNFNNLELPKKHYDGIFSIGVLEYAKYFASGEQSHRDTVKEILNSLFVSLSDNGCIVIAIENRLGLKYLFGAGEDHYGKAYTGVYNYRADDSIRTYTKKEWISIFTELGISGYSFLYPFPDYKVPSVILRDEYLRNNPCASTHFSRVASRDYANLLSHESPEQIFWEGLQQENLVGSLSNSFLFVLSRSNEAVNSLIASDFVHCSGSARKPVYRTVSNKPSGKEIVYKTKVYPKFTPPSEEAQLLHRPTEEEFVVGATLADHWRQEFLCGSSLNDFEKPLRSYYDYLLNCCSDYESSGELIDLLPFNIIVSPDGGYQAIDHEWVWLDGEIEPGFVLFRALLYFAINEQSALRGVFVREEIHNIRRFIQRGFIQIGIDLDVCVDKYIEMENQIQSISRNKRHFLQIREELDKGISAYQFQPTLSWVTTTGSRGDLKCSAYLGHINQTLKYHLPTRVNNISSIRFSPGVTGFIHLHEFTVYSDNNDGEVKIIVSLSASEIVHKARFEDVDLQSNEDCPEVLFSKCDDAGVVFDLPEMVVPTDASGLSVAVKMDWPVSKDFGLFRDSYLYKNERLESDLVLHRRQIAELRAEKFQLSQANNTIQKELKTAKKELELIKSSRVWESAEKGRRLLYGTLLNRPLNGTAHASNTTKNLDSVSQSAISTDFARGDELTVSDANKSIQQVFEVTPKISIVMPVFNTDPQWLEIAVTSVKGQTYENWELCVVDDGSDDPKTRIALNTLNDPKIKFQAFLENRGISEATNAGLRMASGEYIAFMDHDDELTPEALYQMVVAINEHDPDVVYSDEDLINPQGEYVRPHYKPDYSPDLLLAHNYITHLLLIRSRLINEIGELRPEFDGAQDFDFILRACEKTNRIHHISKILYHWRQTPQSTSLVVDAKPAAMERARDVVCAALKRRGIKGTVSHANMPYFYRIERKIEQSPLVSIIIPFKDRADLLDLCVAQILENSTYKNFKIIGISNNSELDETRRAMRDYEVMDDRVKFYEFNNPFNFSKIVNFGVQKSSGDHIVLLNNDIRLITWNWIEALVQHSQRDEVGAVGGKLYYPDNTVQHAGIIVGIDGFAGHGHKHASARANGYFNRLQVTHNVSAVTGAFMMVKKSLFERIGGFDEDHFQVACNDVDFCLRLRDAGFYNVFTPYAEAYHDESASRGYETSIEKKSRFETEKEFLVQRHADIFENGDPFYNPNLTHTLEDFSARA